MLINQKFIILLLSVIIIKFDKSNYKVNEDKGPVQPILVLSNPSSTDITVQVRDNSNTATGEQTQQHYYKQHVNSNNLTGGGVDYNSGPYNIRITAGKTEVTFNVLIKDDRIMESDEKFQLKIQTVPNHVTTKGSSKCTITIVDNDRK